MESIDEEELQVINKLQVMQDWSDVLCCQKFWPDKSPEILLLLLPKFTYNL